MYVTILIIPGGGYDSTDINNVVHLNIQILS